MVALGETYVDGLWDTPDLWLYYFGYCEAGFATRTLGDLILVLSRAGERPAGGQDFWIPTPRQPV